MAGSAELKSCENVRFASFAAFCECSAALAGFRMGGKGFRPLPPIDFIENLQNQCCLPARFRCKTHLGAVNEAARHAIYSARLRPKRDAIRNLFNHFNDRQARHNSPPVTA